MGFDNPELEIRLQQARRDCEFNADRMRNACHDVNNVKITKRRAKVINHDTCDASCACKSVQSDKVQESENGTHRLPVESDNGQSAT